MFLVQTLSTLIYSFCAIKKDTIINNKSTNMFNGNLTVIFTLMEVLSFLIDFYILFKSIVIAAAGIFNLPEIRVTHS